MSNNILNPEQTFRDSTGAVRAFGTITVYENNTTTKAAIYSDADLTVTQSNPYTLDAYGRVVGDLTYAGVKTIAIANEDGSDVVTYDDVASTNDTAGEWAVPVAATYVSAAVFTVVGDQTTDFHVGRKVKLTGGSDRYGYVLTSVFTTLTTVTLRNITDGSSTPILSDLHASNSTAAWSLISNHLDPLSYGAGWRVAEEISIASAATVTQDIVIKPGGHLNITAATTLSGDVLIEPGGTLTIGAAVTQTSSITCVGTINFTSTQTLAAKIQVLSGGIISAAGSVTGTISGALSAGPYLIISGAGTITITADVSIRYPQWYGVVGDGSTDNLAAMNLLPAGHYYVPDGTYMLSDTYKIPSNMVFTGAGIDKTIFKADTAGSFEVFASSTRTGAESDDGEKTNIQIYDMTIDGNTTTTSGTYSALYFTFCNQIRVRNVKCINADDACLRIDGYGQTFEDGAYLDSDSLATDPLDTTNTSAVVTVNHDRHGLNSNALVTLAGCTATNGIPANELNTEHTITVTSDNAYTITVTTPATSTGSGGGSSVVASNARHSTRWSQSSDFRFENIIADNGTYGIEVEGGATGGVIKGCTTSNIENHNIRLTSAENTTVADNDMTGGQTGIWIDRSRRVSVRDNRGTGITLHGMPVGIVHDSKFKDNDFQITDPVTYTGITDNYNRTAAGVKNCIFEGNTSNGKLSLIGGTDDTIVKHNIMDLDLVRAANSNIIVEDNIGALDQGAGLDAGSALLGGNVNVMRHFNAGVPGRYTQFPYLGIRAFAVFDGTNTGTFAPDQSMGVDDITRNSTGNYTINLTDNMYTTNYGVLTICQWNASFAAQISRLVSKATTGPNILILNSSFAVVDSNNITVIIIGT
jgi:hypothetical protein